MFIHFRSLFFLEMWMWYIKTGIKKNQRESAMFTSAKICVPIIKLDLLIFTNHIIYLFYS